MPKKAAPLMTFDASAPCTVEFWLTDYGAKRPCPRPFHVIARSYPEAMLWITRLANKTGEDLDVLSYENL